MFWRMFMLLYGCYFILNMVLGSEANEIINRAKKK